LLINQLEEVMTKVFWMFGLFVFSSILYFGHAFAALVKYPDRPIRLVVPFAPGGNTDIFARVIGAKVTERLGQQVVVDNRAGAGATIGTAVVARAAPDGYTLLMVSGSHVVNPHIYKSLPYDTLKDFVPITLVVDVPSVLVANPSVPARTVSELVNLAKASPGKLNYASSGTGTFAHLAFELFNNLAGVKIQHIAYKGNGPATTDLLGGQVQFMMGAQPAAMPHIQANKLVPIGVTSAKRSPQLPNIPTISESLPGYEFNQGFGMLAPAGTPRPIIETLNKVIVEIIKTEEVRKIFSSQGAVPVGNSVTEYTDFIRTEIGKMAKVVKEAGLKPN